MLPTPDAVILDLDGTLVDTVETRIRAWLAVFEEFGIPAGRAQVAPLIGIDGRRLAREVAAEAGVELPPGGDETIDHRSGELYGELNRDPRPLPGARELLVALDERGMRWAIATSSRREQVATSIDALDLPRQPRIVDGSSVTHAKPEPDLLLLAARELGVASASCWYVGDSTWDMRAASAAEQVPVAVLAGSAVDADALRAAGAAATLDSLDDLLPMLLPPPLHP
jgi:HAD superfamily hydrolase (TIGR01509 family)